MTLYDLQPGDMIYAGKDIYNDGSFPGSEDGALLVKRGTKGVIVNLGFLEDDEDRLVFLVKFQEGTADTAELGPPIGCWVEDIACL